MPLTKFVDALPIPSVLRPHGDKAGLPYYKVAMREVQQKLHRDLPPTTVWGYNGSYPGPTIEALRGHPIFIKWKNKLPFTHLLPVDTTVHGAEPSQPPVRTVVHVHGGRMSADSDGYPEAWFTRDFQSVGPQFLRKTYYYPNSQPAATLWYHDHALGITRLNVYAGLAGFYLLRDEREDALNLPRGPFEIPLVIQDRSFYEDGRLFYPQQPGHEPPPAPQPSALDTALPNPSVAPEFAGNTILVNGKVWPYLEVEPRKYRFRILNGSNARFYRIQLNSGQNFIQIGTDGGFLEYPVGKSQIILAPAERADVIIDFSGHNGEHIILTNDAPTPFPGGIPVTGDLRNIMQFRVKDRLHQPDKSVVPQTLGRLKRLEPTDAVTVRKNTLVEGKDKFGRPLLLLNNMRWDDLPLTETPYNGTVEIWELYNATNDTHPIHLHLVQFQILDRAPFTGEPNGSDVVVGPSRPPDANEMGWKDTVRANPQEVTRIIARFGPFSGIYPWHCHILEHEDYDMMRPYTVLPLTGPRLPPHGSD